jgi:folylpolyglutamate synthase
LFCLFPEITTLAEKDFKIESKLMLPPREFLYDDASNGGASHNYFPCSAVMPSLPLTIKWLRDCVKEHPSTRLQVSNVDGYFILMLT